MQKLSDYVMQRLAREGVRHVFFVPGGAAMHLNDSLGGTPGLRYVVQHHEQACAIAAEAHARVTNNLGACLVTAGPGATNALTGVVAAWQDSTPCLFLSGQVKRENLAGASGVRQMGVQEVDIVSMVRLVTKHAVTLMDPSAVRREFEKAVWLARSGRPGPVWIDIPLDVQGAQIDAENLEPFAPEPSGDDAEALSAGVLRTRELLSRAQRPLILAGNGIRLARGIEAFRQLVDRLQVPVLTTRLGVDLIPYAHELCCGMPGVIASRGANFTLQNCDLLIILGARVDLALVAYAPQRVAPWARKIMVNIDPAEIRKLGAVIDVPVVADVRRFMEALLTASGSPSPRRPEWLDHCRRWKQEYPFELPASLVQGEGLSMYAFSAALSDALGEDDVVLPGNSGFAAEIFLTALRAKPGQRIFHNKGTGAMGFCQPAAIGACLGAGGHRTVCVDGDGGFQLNVQELETVRRLNLPIKFFVIDNRGYASIRASQAGYFKRLTGADATSGLTLPDYGKVAAAYGIEAVRIDGPDGLVETIRRVLESPGPVVCEVVVKPDEPRAPRVSSMQRPDGSMESMPLENMWPFLPADELERNMIAAKRDPHAS
jgi:acetolactate synthase-1/2/3 large subunit